MSTDSESVIPTAIVAGGLAAVLSGIPSTAWALLTGNDPWAATRAAGALFPGRGRNAGLMRGAVVHLAVSGWWAAALALVAPRRRIGPVIGGAAGLAIAAIDLGVIGRRVPAIAALPQGPQWVDHVAFGAVLGWGLSRPSRGRAAR